jgi:hypothetical protein
MIELNDLQLAWLRRAARDGGCMAGTGAGPSSLRALIRRGLVVKTDSVPGVYRATDAGRELLSDLS